MPFLEDLTLPAAFQNQGILLAIFALLLTSLLLHLYLLRRIVVLDRRYKRLLGGCKMAKAWRSSSLPTWTTSRGPWIGWRNWKGSAAK